jgi:NADPH:quinone reductase-like Zn-dependent oxidoreductase
MTEMKAVIQTRYGGPELLELISTPIPAVKENEVLIQIKATNVASGDWRVNTLSVPTILKPIMRLIFGFRGPRQKIRGVTAAGSIVETGSKVTSYEKGNHVYFINTMKAGCLAEFIVLKESAVMAKIPNNMDFIEAAPLAFGAMSAYHFVNQNTVQQNMKVLIYGASGSVGSYAVQLAKYYGAEVTAVSSSKHHEALLNLGVNHVIDYTEHDFRADTKQYDFILDAVGKITKRSCKPVLNTGGKYYSVKSPTKEDSKRLESINKIIEEGGIETLIDKVYPFEEFKEAHIHTYGGHKCGNVIIQISKEL